MGKKKKAKSDDSLLLAETVVKGILEKKGKNITWLNLKEIPNAVCDYFIICEGDSNVHIDAISGSIEDTVEKDLGEKPWHSEGKQNAQWILIDFVSVVVHVFQSEVRSFYNLEDLWADAKVMEVEYQH